MKRILFVNDESRFFTGIRLRMMMAAASNSWIVHCRLSLSCVRSTMDSIIKKS